MKIRPYQSDDKQACLEIFKSNSPKFFDEGELQMFENWLDHQGNADSQYQSPTYRNSEKDEYYVIETEEGNLVGSGGFYILKDTREARLAWGMIHNEHHRNGYGTALYQFRAEQIKQRWPNHILTLGTSQHTFSFYEKMGLSVVNTVKSGYGKDLDQYDMVVK